MTTNDTGRSSTSATDWRATAVDRAIHRETCSEPDHRACDRPLKVLRWMGAQLIGDYAPEPNLEARMIADSDSIVWGDR